MKLTLDTLENAIKNGDIESIIQTLDPFLRNNARGIARCINGNGYMEEDDFYQAGCEAICKNFSKFKLVEDNKEKNFGNFVSFFTMIARYAMLEQKNKSLHKIYLPSTINFNLLKVFKIAQEHSEMDTDELIAKIMTELKLKHEVAKELLWVVRSSYFSLDEPNDFTQLTEASPDAEKINSEHDAELLLGSIKDKQTRKIVEDLIVNRRSLSHVYTASKLSMEEIAIRLKQGVGEMREFYGLHHHKQGA